MRIINTKIKYFNIYILLYYILLYYMSLANSINIFYKKYKKPLAILVLLFFIYKVFIYYYGNIYEGFNFKGPDGFNEATATANQLDEAAVFFRKKATEAKTEAQDNRNKAFGTKDPTNKSNLLTRAERLDRTANTMVLKADGLNSKAYNMRKGAKLSK